MRIRTSEWSVLVLVTWGLAPGCSTRTSTIDAASFDAFSSDAVSIDALSVDAVTRDAPVRVDAGSDAFALDVSNDAFARDAFTVDAFAADAFTPDVGNDAPASGPRFVLGAPLADCNTTCAALGLACAGPGSVGLDCHAHTDLPSCNDPANWVYREHVGEMVRCLPSWGASDPCTNNFNLDNAFCCHCE